MAAKTRLTTLTLNRFRGASQKVEIPFSDKPITLVFGENGTGKSSIIDGLEFVLKESAGSISDISGASVGSHLPSLNSKAKDVSAQVQLGDGSTFSAKLAGSKITSKAIGASPRPNATFLRRSKILSLVTAKPGDRYQALASFIDVSGAETAEESLGKSITEQRRRLDSAANLVSRSSDELQRLFEEHASADETGLGFEQWAFKQAGIETSDLKEVVDSLSSVIKNHDSANEESTEANEQQTLLNSKRQEEERARSGFDTAIKNAPGAADLLLDLYNAGKAYIDAVEEVEKCPLCTNPTSRSQIAAEIAAKLESLPEVQIAKKALDDARAAVKQETEKTQNSYMRLIRCAQSLLASIEQLTQERRQGLKLDSAELSPITALPEHVTREHVTKESIAAAQHLVSQSSAAYSLWEEEHDKLEPRKTLLSSIQTHHKALLSGRKDAKVIEKVRDHLQAMLDVARPVRQDFVQAILASVASDCDRLYGTIHPNEPLGGIHLMLDANKRSSCNITADFCGEKDVPPQAYYSESHMDTLGFALFLALAKRGATCDTILVLDDIFTSVDDKHLRRVCDLLADEAPQFLHVVLSTHVRKIYDWVRSGTLPQNVYGLVELSSQWSLEDGIRTRFAHVERSEVQGLLDAPFLDRTALAGKTRRFLESLLGDTVIALRATAPMKKFGDYELSDYLTGLRSLTKDGWQIRRSQDSAGVLREAHPRESYDLKAKAKQFNEDKNVVNKLVHADERGASYTDDEARNFAGEVLELESYLCCDEPDCGSLIGSKKKFMTCKCGEWKWDSVPASKT